MKNVLTIAGSDPSGGAGIQADIKTMCALGVYGMSAITALTVQNTRKVYDVQKARPDIVAGQIDAVYSDIPVDAVKIGMAPDEEIISVIRDRLLVWGARTIVVDPVMASTSGYRLLGQEAAIARLISIADVVTPNIPEAEMLAEMTIRTEDDMRVAAEKIRAMGAKSVLVKGGHLAGGANDLLLTEEGTTIFPAERIPTQNTHGTGCTLSSAIACGLAKGLTMHDAVCVAKQYVIQAIRDSLELGQGPGPLGHMRQLYREAGLEV
jgi:hydroxymethylpyrimidine/phosphomethylpyrimidine kinase